LLSRFARKVLVNYDGDQAGVQAAKKAIEILLAEDLEVKILVLPEGADPMSSLESLARVNTTDGVASTTHNQFVTISGCGFEPHP